MSKTLSFIYFLFPFWGNVEKTVILSLGNKHFPI